MLVSYFVAAVLLTVPASLIVIAAYRSAVGRAMRRSAGATVPDVLSRPEPRGPAKGPIAGAAAVPLRARLSLVYTAAAALAAVGLTAFTFMTEDIGWTFFRGFLIAYVFCWPLAPTLSALREEPPLHALRVAIGYCLFGAVVVLVWSSISRLVLGRADVQPLANLRGYAQILALTALPPLAIVLVSCTRRLRPVAPLVLAGLLIFSFGALAIQNAFIRAFDVARLRSPLLTLGYTPLFLLASLPMGYLCWKAQGWLGKRHRTKRSSDTQLLVDAWWLIAIFFGCANFSTQIGWRGLWALASFVLYRGVVGIGLARWRVSSTVPPPVRLLLLRVFGAPRRAEQMFDAVANQWRFDGNVNLIGGADLAARTLDPGETLAFLGGYLQSEFVHDAAGLERRLAALDEVRDPDGRFRVNDFFCFDDTWRPTLEALLGRSDVVLMDLRGFSRQNAGCLYEMEKLANHAKLERTLFVLDDDSDEDLLRTTVARALEPMRRAAPALELTRITRPSGRELRKVVSALRGLARA